MSDANRSLSNATPITCRELQEWRYGLEGYQQTEAATSGHPGCASAEKNLASCLTGSLACWAAREMAPIRAKMTERNDEVGRVTAPLGHVWRKKSSDLSPELWCGSSEKAPLG